MCVCARARPKTYCKWNWWMFHFFFWLHFTSILMDLWMWWFCVLIRIITEITNTCMSFLLKHRFSQEWELVRQQRERKKCLLKNCWWEQCGKSVCVCVFVCVCARDSVWVNVYVFISHLESRAVSKQLHNLSLAYSVLENNKEEKKNESD